MTTPTLRDTMMLAALPPQLDALLLALAAVRPQGNDTPMPDDIAAEARRVFAEVRRLSARSLPVALPDPKPGVRRIDLGILIVTAQDHIDRIGWYHKDQRPVKPHALARA